MARRMGRDKAEKKTSAHLLVLFTFISGISMQVSRRAVAKMPSDAFLCALASYNSLFFVV